MTTLPPRRASILVGATLLIVSCASPADSHQEQPGDSAPVAAAEPIVMHEALVVGHVGTAHRSPVHTDAVEASIVAGEFKTPSADDTVTAPDGTEHKWHNVAADDKGWVADDDLAGGYAFWRFHADRAGVMLLEAAGDSVAYVNGRLRTGDPYAYHYVRLPVAIDAGDNEILFRGARGGVQARLVMPTAPISLNVDDPTLPDVTPGSEGPADEGSGWSDRGAWGAVVVTNATESWANDLSMDVSCAGGEQRTPLPAIPPLSVRKVGFLIPASARQADDPKGVTCHLSLMRAEDGAKEDSGSPIASLDQADVTLNLRKPDEARRVTFVSDIDGSVQYYAVQPRTTKPDEPGAALFLTLHGASVEAIRQAGAYKGKDWGTIVAPTNRRPFGFDWEDWGRWDALEVLGLARRRYRPDPTRVYLTGHSMGGHGTWQIGVTFPGRFAAIAPSAGWISFFSYAGGKKFADESPMDAMLGRASNPSDTLALVHNLTACGVYILHGTDDDNVPVTEARKMREVLGGFHRDFAYYERPGARHWWGNKCVDWPPLFDFLRNHRSPAAGEAKHVSFVTMGPDVSPTCRWATVVQQIACREASKVELTADAKARTVTGTTENVRTLSLNLGRVLGPGEPVTIEIDGSKIEHVEVSEKPETVWLRRDGDAWTVGKPVPPSEKQSDRCGPFKDAFRNRMVLVYGTAGGDAQSAWAFRRARYDVETFWYRGNGSIDVVSDTAFLADPGSYADRNVILYGNAETNGAWSAVLGDCPVRVTSKGVTIGDRTVGGDDLACLFVYPRAGSRTASVGVVAGTGEKGSRLTERVPYFVSGVEYPDCIVFGPGMLMKGAAGVRAAGYFGNDWSVQGGDFVWSDNSSGAGS